MEIIKIYSYFKIIISKLGKWNMKVDRINCSHRRSFLIDPRAWWLTHSSRIRKKQVHFISPRSLEPRPFSPCPGFTSVHADLHTSYLSFWCSVALCPITRGPSWRCNTYLRPGFNKYFFQNQVQLLWGKWIKFFFSFSFNFTESS